MVNVAPIDAKLPQYRKDIAASLRALANEIEAGDYQPSLLVVVHDCEKDPDLISTCTQGRKADDIVSCVGMLEMAKALMITSGD
jgi:nitrate reductase NapAB chaperone NapD